MNDGDAFHFYIYMIHLIKPISFFEPKYSNTISVTTVIIDSHGGGGGDYAPGPCAQVSVNENALGKLIEIAMQ